MESNERFKKLVTELVSFNINPGIEGGGPPSGFVTEMGTDQTHNVVQTLPADDDYSPFWDVDVYNNIDFNNVSDWMSARIPAEAVFLLVFFSKFNPVNTVLYEK